MTALLRLAIPVAVLCTACNTVHSPTSAPRGEASNDPLEVVRFPERVLAYRISENTVLSADLLRKHLESGGSGLPKLDESKYVQGFPILLGPVEVPRAPCRKLSRIILDKRNYGYLEEGGSGPTVAFRFYGKYRIVQALLYPGGFLTLYEHDEPVLFVPLSPLQRELNQLVDSFLPSLIKKRESSLTFNLVPADVKRVEALPPHSGRAPGSKYRTPPFWPQVHLVLNAEGSERLHSFLVAHDGQPISLLVNGRALTTGALFDSRDHHDDVYYYVDTLRRAKWFAEELSKK
jgi:hypothetical protein